MNIHNDQVFVKLVNRISSAQLLQDTLAGRSFYTHLFFATETMPSKI